MNTKNNTNKIYSNVHSACKVTHLITNQHIINLRKFYKHKLDDKTLQIIKGLGLKGNSEVTEVKERGQEHDIQIREFINFYSDHCLNAI